MKVALIDLSGIFYQHYHATEHEPVGEAFARTRRDVSRYAEGHDHAAVCIDVRGKTFRHELSEDYKAHREKRPEALYQELDRCVEALGRRYHVFGCKGYEADDVIATLVAWLEYATGAGVPEPRGDSLTVYSADKDLLCLASDITKVVSTKTGDEYGPDEVRSKFGVHPWQMPHWLALVGDKSDGIVGLRGVGPKKAAAILDRWDCVGSILRGSSEHAVEMKELVGPAIAKSIIDAGASGSLERDLVLATLRRDVPIDCRVVLTEKFQEPEPVPERYLSMTQEEEPKPPSQRQTEAPKEPLPPFEVVEGVIETKALSRVRTNYSQALEPRDMLGALKLAKSVVESRLFSSYGNPDAALMVILAGREMGLGAMASLRSFFIVEGKPSMSAQLMMSLALSSPSCQLFRVRRSKCDDTIATVEVQRKEWSTSEVYTWSIDDAKKAGLAGRKNWQNHPRQMLINRAIAEAARFTFPEILANIYETDEMGEAA